MTRATAGGNTLDKAPSGPVSDFVKSHGGHTVITKVSTLYSSSHLRWGTGGQESIATWDALGAEA